MKPNGRRWRVVLAVLVLVGVAGTLVAVGQLPRIGAGALLHPSRARVSRARPGRCEDASFSGAGVTLKAWRCRATSPARATLVYLHGIADTRASAAGSIERFGARGFDVIAYDSRAHGESEGEACTYGFFEKEDLRRVLETIPSGPVVLLGTSLGAAVALQEAAGDPRPAAIVAAETFSDLRTVATERAPFVFSRSSIERSFALAERLAHFRVDEVSPVAAAARIRIPVLVIHGDADRDTPPSHSQRVFDALAGPKRLIMVPGARHNGSLRAEVWQDIERWIDVTLAGLKTP